MQRRQVGLAAACVLLGAGVPLAAPAGADPAGPPAPGAWVWRETASTKTVVDARGASWKPATGLSGGRQLTTRGGIGDTASEQLYQTSRRRASSWTLTVPAPGRYAVNLLVSDTTDAGPGRNVFDVRASDGTVLARRLDVAARVTGYHPYHVTGLVTVTGTTLTLTFTADKGDTIVNALEVTSDGAAAPMTTTLDETFDGPAGTAPDNKVWSYQRGTGWEGDDGLENYTASRQNSALDGKGDLVLTARQVKADKGATGAWTSAELRSKGKFSYGYGRVDARVKVPAGSGFWPALWSKGVNEASVGWPRCGEIDIFESFRGYTRDISGHVHSLGDRSDPPAGVGTRREASLGRDLTLGTDPAKGFHDYAVDYMPGAVTFSVDGNRYFTAAPEDLGRGEAWPFAGQRQYLLLDLAVGDSTATGTPGPSTPSVGKLLVDRLTVTQQ